MARVQFVDCIAVVVQQVAVAAVRCQEQLAVAVGAWEVDGRDHVERVQWDQRVQWVHRDVGPDAVVGVDVATDRVGRGVFHDAGHIGHRSRPGVGDRDVQAVRAALAVDVRGHQRQAVHDLVHMHAAHHVRKHVRVVGVAHFARGRVVAVKHQRAVCSAERDVGGGQCVQLRQREVGSPKADARQARFGCHREVARRRPCRLHQRRVRPNGRHVLRDGDHRDAVGVAVDGDRQARCAGAAVTIGDGVAEHVRQALARVQFVDCIAVVVQQVAVAAVTVQLEVTVRQVLVHRRHRVGLHVRADAVVGVEVAADGVGRRVFHDAGHIGHCGRFAVGNEDVQPARHRMPCTVRQSQPDRIHNRRTTAVVLRRDKAVVVAHNTSRAVVARQRHDALAGVDAHRRCGQR